MLVGGRAAPILLKAIRSFRSRTAYFLVATGSIPLRGSHDSVLSSLFRIVNFR